jgi:hypothetical protein
MSYKEDQDELTKWDKELDKLLTDLGATKEQKDKIDDIVLEICWARDHLNEWHRNDHG